MKEKSCCFTGNRIIVDSVFDVREKIKLEIEKLIYCGIFNFYNGGALGFDTISALVVLELKIKHPNIRLIMLLPCINQCKYWLTKDKDIYEYILKQADEVIYISEEYTTHCMLDRNKALIDNSSYCICYNRKTTGGTVYTILYGKKQGIKIILI